MSEQKLTKKQIYDKEYRQRDYVKAKAKDYYIINRLVKKEYRQKPEVKEKANTHHDCECGGKYTTKHKAKHIKSDKHKMFVENNKQF